MVMEDGVVTSRTVDGVPQAIEFEANKKKEKKKKSGESKHAVHVWISVLVATVTTMFLQDSHVRRCMYTLFSVKYRAL